MEHKRDDSLDYLKILRALKELPFNVGKNLLADFLVGSYQNKSISKNKLDELHHFGILNWPRERIFRELDNLVALGMVEWIVSDFNQFIKLLRITQRGQQELLQPTIPGKQLKNNVSYLHAKVTEEDRADFEHFNGFLEGFNDQQKKAIISPAQKILCVAGAGSGKTSVLTKRIEFLVKHKHVLPQKILAITFTRKARRQMERRLAQLGVTQVPIHTFNSFCERILRRHEREIYGRGMRVQNYGDKILAMNLALSHMGISMDDALSTYFSKQQRKFKTGNQLSNNFMHDCFSVMEFFKLSGQQEYDFSNDAEPKDRSNAKMIYRINQYLKQHMDMQGLRDYSDQMIDALKFLRDNSQRIPSFDHVLIDEYQDVNAMQIELLDLLKAPSLFAVGDPRQSIFGWRGSDIRYILDFQKKHDNTEVITLHKNYRSSKKIVSFMNKAIMDMGLKDLEHHHDFARSSISLHQFDSEHEEREHVLKSILESDIPRDDIFVLARTNRQILELSQIMKAANIAHVVKTDEVRRPVSGNKGDVTLATIHAIKGLEAREIFLIGATEQNFPCKATDHPAIEMIKMSNYNKTEEEKRLFYVALSRAKERLHISYSGKKPTYFLTEDMKKMVDQ